MKVATKDLTGNGLAYAVALAEGWGPFAKEVKEVQVLACRMREFSGLSWAACGPIIERELIELAHERDWRSDGSFGRVWEARAVFGWFDGDDPLTAAMRCYVASKLGAEVDVPAELLS